jgi:phenylacetate-CoA ligase
MPEFDFAFHEDGSATLIDGAGRAAGDLRALFARLRERSPHYRALLPPLAECEPVAALAAMPATEKTTYRTELAREALADLRGENFVIDFSSGSTARPVQRFCRAADDLSEQEATERAFRRAGIGRGDRLVFIDVGMAQIYEFYARAARSLGVAEVTYLQMTQDLDATLLTLRRLRPDAILIIPSLLSLMERHLSELWPGVASPVRCVIGTGEPTPPKLRVAVKEAWGAQVFSLYGTTETGCLASECACEDGHHFDVDAHVLTLRNTNRIDNSTVEGELLLTTTQIQTQAVVKYAVGDIVRVSTVPCRCGEETPRIWHLHRTQDAFVFAGEKFHHRMILDVFRRVAPDLEALTLEIDDVPEGPEHVLLRAVVPESFAVRKPLLLDTLRKGIFELDSLVHAGLVRVDVDCRQASASPRKRKSVYVIDRRGAA